MGNTLLFYNKLTSRYGFHRPYDVGNGSLTSVSRSLDLLIEHMKSITDFKEPFDPEGGVPDIEFIFLEYVKPAEPDDVRKVREALGLQE